MTTVMVTANGQDQSGLLQNYLGQGYDIIINGKVYCRKWLKARCPGAKLRYWNGPDTDILQFINGPAPIYDHGNLIFPRRFTVWKQRAWAYTLGSIRHPLLEISADDVEVNGVGIYGTKRKAGRSVSFDDPFDGSNQRNWLEAQTGVQIIGADGVLIKDVDIYGVWGDFAGVNPSGSGVTTKQCSHVVIDGGTWDLAGRHGIGCNGFIGDGTEGSGLTWRNTTVKEHVSSLFHVEQSGTNGGNPNAYMSDLLIEDITHMDGDGQTIHVRHGYGIDRVIIRRVHDTGLLYVDFAPQSGTSHRSSDFVIGGDTADDGNTWGQPANEVLQIRAVDNLTVKNNAGHLLFNGNLFDAAALATCTNVVQSNPQVVRDPQFP